MEASRWNKLIGILTRERSLLVVHPPRVLVQFCDRDGDWKDMTNAISLESALEVKDSRKDYVIRIIRS